jgi:2-hydroxy-3-oxopropionate reductase
VDYLFYLRLEFAMKVGFIGLGIMGKPMAKNLIKAGHELVVLKKSKGAGELAALGAKTLTTVREIASECEVVITMLPNSPEVKDVALGKDGVIEGAKRGGVLIDMSSIAPLQAQEIGKKLAEKGIEMLDAPVSGGEPKAIAGTLSVMVGGKQEIFDKYAPMLKGMAASVVRTGELGAGNVTKLCNQVMVAIQIASMSEALVLAAKAGLDPQKVFEAIRGGLAGSAVLEAKGPLVMDRKFSPGFRVKLHVKDLANVLETSRGLNLPMPLTASVMEMMQSVIAEGGAEDDHGSLVKYFERQGKVEVKRG